MGSCKAPPGAGCGAGEAAGRSTATMRWWIAEEGICLQCWKSAAKPGSCSAGELDGAGGEESPSENNVQPRREEDARYKAMFLLAFEPLLVPRSHSCAVASPFCCTCYSAFLLL